MKKRFISAVVFLLIAAAFVTSCAKDENDPKKAAMTYKDVYMSEAEYSYWFSTLKAGIVAQYGSADGSFWDTETRDGVKYSDLVGEKINGQIMTILIASELFDEYGLTLPDGTDDAIDYDIAEKEDFAGGRANLEKDLAEFGMTVDDLKQVYLTQARISQFRSYFASTVADKLEDYYKENYRAVKVILIYTGISFVTDVDGNYVYNGDGTVKTLTLDEFQKKQKRELVDTVAEALKNGADVDECVAEFSEKDYSGYPNGLLISRGDAAEYGEDVIDAVFSLEEGEVGTVEDTLMTFIIYRSKLPELSSLTDVELGMLSGIADDMVDAEIDALFTGLAADVKINENVTGKYDVRTVRKNSYY